MTAKNDTKDNTAIDPAAAKDNDMCLICFADYSSSKEKEFLPCAHCFHRNCLDQWLAGHNSCPVCRTVVRTRTAQAQADDLLSTTAAKLISLVLSAALFFIVLYFIDVCSFGKYLRISRSN